MVFSHNHTKNRPKLVPLMKKKYVVDASERLKNLYLGSFHGHQGFHMA